MRRRLKRPGQRLHETQGQKLTRDELLLKLGAAKKEAERAYLLVAIQLPDLDQEVNAQTFTFALRKDKLRMVRRREGSYLPRPNLTSEDPAELWCDYTQLTEIEKARADANGRRAGADHRWPRPILPRYTQPNADQQLPLSQLKLTLPEQPPPRIQSQLVRAA
jgi:hypothetical protein